MVEDWRKEKAWSDKFIPAIQESLGGVFFKVATVADDQIRNTDLICMDMAGKRIAARIRRKDFINKYPFQFTIRSSRPSGTKTELQKILSGWGDYIFYGFSDNAERGLLTWLIGDLEIFRQHFRQGEVRRNRDRSSTFTAIKWQAMPPEFFVAFSPIELLMMDTCHYCFSERQVHEGHPNKRLCTKCHALFDYTLMVERHLQMRKRVKPVAVNA